MNMLGWLGHVFPMATERLCRWTLLSEAHDGWEAGCDGQPNCSLKCFDQC